uniref:Uncharacterized protein n=1 Tax=viral metagenome TaxID=1070528 RepID=A0A6C0KFC8_9ZZZZ
MNTMNSIKMYIPRMLGTTTSRDVVNTFKHLNIGNVFYIDMHKRVNENQNAYYFAFLIVNLFDTPESKKIENVLNNTGITRVYYNKENEKYWEIKKHIDSKERSRTPSPTSVAKAHGFDMVDANEWKNKSKSLLYPTHFTISDKRDLEEECEQLMNEVFSFTHYNPIDLSPPKNHPSYPLYSLF